MKTVIYVDVLLALNFFITYLLLLCTSKLLGVFAGIGRLMPGTVLGAAYSLIILAPSVGMHLTLLLKLCMCVSIVCISFRPRSIRRIVRYSLAFFAVSTAFAGIMMLIDSVLNPGFMTFNNGTVYFGIGFFSLIACAVVSYFLVLGVGKLLAVKLKRTVKSVQIHCDGLYAEGTALMDTGNTLFDAAGNRPAVVATFDFVKPLLPETLYDFFRGNIADTLPENNAWNNRISVLPASTVTDKTVLPAFHPDALIIQNGGRRQRIEKITIAVVPHTLGDESYEVLLNPAIYTEINGKEEVADADTAKISGRTL